MGGQKKPLTDLKYADKFPELIRLYNQAPRLMIHDIADRLEIPRGAISSVLQTLQARGLVEQRKGRGAYNLSEARLKRVQEIQSMYTKDKKTIAEIARHYGVSHQAIWQVISQCMPRARRYDRDVWISKLISLYEAGMNQADIARQLNRSRATVVRAISEQIKTGRIRHRRARAKQRTNPAVMKKVETIHAMRVAGVPWSAIAVKLGKKHYTGLCRLYNRHRHELK
jgi:DNA-binding transcriptional regulator LsrR (DeoR family)